MNKLANLLAANLFVFSFLYSSTVQTLERTAAVYVRSGALEGIETSQATGCGIADRTSFGNDDGQTAADVYLDYAHLESAITLAHIKIG